MRVKSKWKRVLLGFWVVMVLVIFFFVLVWSSRIDLARQQLRISRSVSERILLIPWFLISLEEKPSSKADALGPLEGNMVCWLFLNHLTLQDVSSPVTGLPREGNMSVVIKDAYEDFFVMAFVPQFFHEIGAIRDVISIHENMRKKLLTESERQRQKAEREAQRLSDQAPGVIPGSSPVGGGGMHYMPPFRWGGWQGKAGEF
jgi:hypothetical protein